MNINSAGSFIKIERGVDYAPKWINTSPRLTNSAANSDVGAGYWTPVIFAIHVIAPPTKDVTIYTLDDNTDLRSPHIMNYHHINGGNLTPKKYFYSLSVYDGDNWSYPSHPIEVNSTVDRRSVKLEWVKTKGAVKQMLFRSSVYGVLGEKFEIHPDADHIVDDGSLSFVANDISFFGRSTNFPLGAFKVGEVYNMYFRKYEGGDDDVFMGYRTVNAPIELKMNYFTWGS